MKKIPFVVLLLLSAIFSACDDDTYTVGVDLQESFDQDDVRLLLNGKEILNQKVQASSFVGIAYSGGVVIEEARQGKQELKVIINDTVVKTASFSLKRDTYIGVKYNRQNEEVSFVYADSPFMYY